MTSHGEFRSYTVKQVAQMSHVSIRTLHFYDEMGLLKPAYYGTNGYRFYEEEQLLILQQILFYRELGFELKRIKQVLGRTNSEKMTALESHRKVLETESGRIRTLIDTIDKTISHLKGTTKMKSEDLFTGFSVAPGDDRFGEHITLGGAPNDCKLSGQDTGGAIAVFEFSGLGGWQTGESVFIPRHVAHAWVCAERPAKIINTYQPAGNIEGFFRELGKHVQPPVHEDLSFDEMRALFDNHGMKVVGPPLVGEWTIEDGKVVQLA